MGETLRQDVTHHSLTRFSYKRACPRSPHLTQYALIDTAQYKCSRGHGVKTRRSR